MLVARVDASRAIARLAALPAKLEATMRAVTRQEAAALLGRVHAKLSGDVLHIRTGALYRSIEADVLESAGKVAGVVRSDGSVAYARIQEYGGRTMTANRAIEIPARSYLRSTLSEQRDAFLQSVRKLVNEAVQ